MKIFKNISGFYKQIIITLTITFLGATDLSAQNTLEFAKLASDGNPEGNGAVVSTTINFLQNTTGNTFSQYNLAPLSATISFVNQQYSASAVSPLSASLVMGHSGQSGSAGPEAIYSTNAWLGTPANNNFTSVNSSGIDIASNYAVSVRNFTRAIGASHSPRAKVLVARMEVTFNRPVTNPIIHLSGLGGDAASTGYRFSTTLDINLSQSNPNTGITLTRLSGTSNFGLLSSSTSISNNFSSSGNNGNGSVRINGTNIQKVSFDVYLDGHDSNSTSTPGYWTTSEDSGDAFGISFSVSQALPSVSGTVYIDNNGFPINNSGGLWTTANTLYVNAIGANGNVIATSLVNTSGVFTFPANGAMIEGQIVKFQLSRFQGTVGQLPPAIDLPGSWATVGESITSGPTDGAANGEFTLTIGSANSPNNTTNLFGVTACSVGTTAPPVVTNINNVCPATTANLANAHLETVPTGANLVWFTNNLHTGTALTSAQSSAIATNGTYYAFYYSASNNCYSPASSAVVVTITNRIDTDGDGIPDECDLDDDNDGILDTVECPPTNVVTNGTFNTNLSGWSAGSGWSYSTIGGNGLATNLNNSVNPSILSQSVTNLTNGTLALNLKIGAQDYSYAQGSTGSIEVLLNGVIYATFTNGTLRNNSNITLALSNGASSNFQTFGTVGNNSDYAQSAPFTIFIPYTGPSTAVLSFRMFAGAIGDDWSLDDIALNTFSCDTDGDGIPNYLDPDSDNDGCPDVIEGGASFQSGASYIVGNRLITAVNASGVPALPTATPAITGYSQTEGQSIGQSVNYSMNDCIDSDGDSIPDWSDLDDDNDGILDSVECPPTFANFTPATITGGASANATVTGIAFGTITGSLKRDNFGTITNPAGAIIKTTSNMSNPAIFTPVGIAGQQVLGETITNFNNNLNYTRYTLDLSAGVESITLHAINFDFARTRFVGTNHAEQLVSGGTEYVYEPATRQLYDRDPSTFSDITRDGYGSVRITSNNGQPITQIVFERFDEPGSNFDGDGCFYTFSIQTVCDADGDGIPNRLDLDSDNDGCSDAIEGAGDFTALVNSNMAGGNTGATSGTYNQPVIQNLGNSVNTTAGSLSYGVPLVAGAGQAIGTAATADPVIVAGTASADQIIISGATPTNLTLASSTGAIQWQVSIDNVAFNNVASGGNTATYSPGPLTAKRYYRALVTSVGGCTVTSNVVTITVCAAGGIAPVFNDYFSGSTVIYSKANSSYTITCESGLQTANLAVLVAAPAAPATTIVTWHSATPATEANRINPVVAVTGATRKVYAAFFDNTNKCFSPTKEVTIYGPICATNDNYTATPILYGVPTTLPIPITSNDTYLGSLIGAPNPNVSIAWEIGNNAVIINPNGTLTFNTTAPTLAPGTYTYLYKICDIDPDAVTDSNCSFGEVTFRIVTCTNPPSGGMPTSYTQTGISNLEGFTSGTSGWPGNIPNGFIAIESKNQGFVITRVANTSVITNPVIGMLIYDMSNSPAPCVKLYSDLGWNCLAKDCLPAVSPKN